MGFYIVGAVKLNSTLIPYSSVNLSPEFEKTLLNSDARSGHSFTGIAKAGPVCKITTPALASVLNLTGLGGVVLTGLELYVIKHDAVAVASGSAHRKWTCTAALARIDSISTNNGHAEITLEISAVYDGTNAVWAMTDGVALPTQTRVTDVWYQGPLYLTSTLYQIEQSTFTVNQEVIKRYSNGDVGPAFVGLKPSKPTLAVSAADGILHGLAGGFGDNVGPVTMFYRKGAEGDGLRVDDATTTHIQITIPSAFMTPDGVDGSPAQEVGFSVTFDCRDDGTNALVSLDTTAAIAAPV